MTFYGADEACDQDGAALAGFETSEELTGLKEVLGECKYSGQDKNLLFGER